ncbi:MAG: DUF4388 domain-containing protein [Planctomycetes bacterium]|nr:DUF4388 domain-containing protein [Planctomycetota bacterium]
MTTPVEPAQDPDDRLSGDLRARISAMVDRVVKGEEKGAKEELEVFLVKAWELCRRKLAMQGTKADTRDLLGEILFSRLRRGFREFLRTDDAKAELKAAEWAIGALVAGSALSDFAAVIDRAILDAGSLREYSFAGRADFISLEEIMQLLGAGKHVGCLSLEKPDNRLDIYFDRGIVAFLDPHHLVRRMLPGRSKMAIREIPAKMLADAEQRRTQKGTPIFLSLRDLGFLKPAELRDAMRLMGTEVLYDFLREQNEATFFYRRLDEVPDFVREHHLRLGVTPILLEGNKRLDDWRNLCRAFPDPDQAVQQGQDMFTRLAELDLGVMEIKLLAFLNGENSPRQLVSLMGLPLQDVYAMLVRLARDGVVIPPGGDESLPDSGMLQSDDSMEEAFAALDANDDDAQLNNALDKVLGSLGGDDGGEGKLDLDKLDLGRRR